MFIIALIARILRRLDPQTDTGGFQFTITTLVTWERENPLPSFSPPSSCLGAAYTLSPSGSDLYDPIDSIISRAPHQACFPPEAIDISSGAIFTPGTCPDDFLTVDGGITAYDVEFTYAVCCPA